jgi:hypothetical protein
LFQLIDHQLQDGLGIWMLTVLDGSPIEWGLPSLSLSGSSCSVGFLVCAALVQVAEHKGLGISSISAHKGTSFFCNIVSVFYAVSTVRCAGTLFCFVVLWDIWTLLPVRHGHLMV